MTDRAAAAAPAPTAPPTRPRSRLLVRIYLVGLAQLAVVGLSIFVVQRLLERAPRQFDPARQKALLDSFAEFYDEPSALARALGKLNDVDLTFYRNDDQLVASTRNALPPLTAGEHERLAHASMIFVHAGGPVPITAAPVVRDGVTVGYGLVHFNPPSRRGGPPALGPPPPRGHPPHHHTPAPEPSLLPPPSRLPIVIACALLGAAIVSILFARSLARPLAQLARATHAFGAGDLTARARLSRHDELGAVARTFDEMADRVNALLRAQREFLANVSHELRTPLARIRVALDIAAEGDLESARQSLREIAEDWGDLDRLVEDVLTVARLELGRDPSLPAVTLRCEPLDARALVARAAASFRAMHPGHALALEGDELELPVWGDGALLRRVLDNLLQNAAKYSERGTTVRVSLRRRYDEVEVTVSDAGMGIDAADLPRLFEPFFRTDRSRARKTGGVGLGLALARRIVEAHRGAIEVESQVGVGTTVRFRVPSSAPV